MLQELWPFAIFWPFNNLLYCAWQKFRIMYANVLNFIYGFLMKKKGDLYFFSYPNYLPFQSYFSFNKITLKSHIFVLLLPSWASSVGVKQCQSQAVRGIVFHKHQLQLFCCFINYFWEWQIMQTLIWVYIVFSHFFRNFGVQNFRTFTVAYHELCCIDCICVTNSFACSFLSSDLCSR